MQEYYFERVIKSSAGETSQFEPVALETWQWEAGYKNGKVLKQFDSTLPIPQLSANAFRFHQLKEIDQNNLVTFKVFHKDNPNRLFLLKFDPDMRLIFYYMRKVFNFRAANEKRITLYVYGYQKKVLYRTIKVFNVIMPDGNLITTSDPNLIKLDFQ